MISVACSDIPIGGTCLATDSPIVPRPTIDREIFSGFYILDVVSGAVVTLLHPPLQIRLISIGAGRRIKV